MTSLQWGGRFANAPDDELLRFGSSLDEDLVLAPFDVACSLAHVEALLGGSVVDDAKAATLTAALRAVAAEIADGTFATHARATPFEDVHGAIDARVRELAGSTGDWLHAARSRNDQVATTLMLYVRDRAKRAGKASLAVATSIIGHAREELERKSVVAGTTHRQPAQPVLLAFVLAAWSEPFTRAAQRCILVASDSCCFSPLGSAALAGSTLPLDRNRAAKALDFVAPSRNALDSISNRDAVLDLAHACVRAVVDASRVAEELIAWSAPAYGYVRLGDEASTGSSLMPQKRNPDTLELVRARAAKLVGAYAGALGTLCGLAPSYQRDLQETKAQGIAIAEDALATLEAFARAWKTIAFARDRMSATALDGYTVATDIADALIAHGTSARVAHGLVGAVVAQAELEHRPLGAADLARLARQTGVEKLQAPLDAPASIAAKRTCGSTAPGDVRNQIASIEDELARLREALS